MTREEAIALLLNISAYDIDSQRGIKKQEALEMAIKALEQEPYICDTCKNKENGWDTEPCDGCCKNHSGYEPCTVSVSEKEPDEISEEISIKFFKNTLKLRWHEFVIYNVEWLKKNWQMEMDIVCGVEPCEDAISRQAVLEIIEREQFKGDAISEIEKLPSVKPQEKTGHWIMSEDGLYRPLCDKCGAHPWKGYIPTVEEATEVFKYCPSCGRRMVEKQEREIPTMYYPQVEGITPTVIKSEPSDDAVSIAAYKQVMWERDIAIEQLKELGYEWGEKIESCGDTISKEDAIKALDAKSDEFPEFGEAIYILENLSPVNLQEPKTGHWIQTNEFFINQDGQFIYKFICSECKSLSYFRKSNKKAIGANVCPNCGAKMEGSDKE